MFTGKHGDYWWLEAEAAVSRLPDVLEACPALVVGRYVAVTAFDGGPFNPNDNDRAAGWTADGVAAYSAKVHSPDDLPLEQYDEWYVFERPTRIARAEVFVIYGDFSLLDRSADGGHRDDAARRWLHEIQRRFWRQLERLRPETYLAEGDRLALVTRRRDIFDCASHVLEG
jgi:hypothetical protein